MQGNQTEKYTLLYGRISNEDKREGTGLSIQHQKEILRDFVHHITVHERDGAYKKKFYTQKIGVYFNYIGTVE